MRDRAYGNKGHDPGNMSIARLEDTKPKQKKNSEETDSRLKEKQREGKKKREKESEKEREKSQLASEKPIRKTSEEKNWELSLKYFKLEDYPKADKR